jgi:hypothetical protein
MAGVISVVVTIDPFSAGERHDETISRGPVSASGGALPVVEVKASPTIQPRPPLPAATAQSRATTTYFVPPDADQSVKDAFADGTVTFDEYTEAVNDDMACLDAKGVEHSPPSYNQSTGQYDYTIVSPAGPTDGLSPEDECWMRYERDVQAAWVKENQGSSKPIIIDEAGALRCAAELGIPATTIAELQAQKQAHPLDPYITHCWDIATIGYDPSDRSSSSP